MKTDNIAPFTKPPGCLTETLRHPGQKEGTIQLALFQEHRFAFYYWLKWTQEMKGIVPSLVTFDWHQDLCPPYNDQVPEMKKLKIDNPVEVALYSWGKLSRDNDVQIHAALKHNMLKDVYVICRQDVNRKRVDTVKDFTGNKHMIYIFKSIEDFENHLPNIKDNKIYLDIDLDYFTLSNPLSVKCPYQLRKFTYMKKAEVAQYFSPSTSMMQWIFERIAGFTIATEPKFCGGLKRSNYYLSLLEQLYFKPSLFHIVPGSATKYTKWKHVK